MSPKLVFPWLEMQLQVALTCLRGLTLNTELQDKVGTNLVQLIP